MIRENRLTWFNDKAITMTNDGLDQRERKRLRLDDEFNSKILLIETREKCMLIEQRIIGIYNYICYIKWTVCLSDELIIETYNNQNI